VHRRSGGRLIGAQLALLAPYTIVTRSDEVGDIEFVVVRRSPRLSRPRCRRLAAAPPWL
jgi:hypothetical protein